MIQYLPLANYKTLVLCSAIVLIGCSGDDPPSTPADSVGSTTCTTSYLPKADDEPCEVSPQALALETEIDGELKSGNIRIYQVASGADISLVSNSGDVDLFLFDNIEDINNIEDIEDINNVEDMDFEDIVDEIYDSEKLLCYSAWAFKENVCSASAADGELYALVLAYSDTAYRIGATAECSVTTVNRWAYRNMLDYYLYANEVPEIDPDVYKDPFELVNDLRFERLDPFSNLSDAVIQTKFFEEGVAFGLGYNWALDANGNLRMIFIYTDSPFGRAGIKRGDIAISINAESVIGMTDDRYDELVGPAENPLTSTWEFVDGESGETKWVSVISAEYRFNSVLHSSVYTQPDTDSAVGYIVLKQFVEPSVDELNSVIESFKENGVTELVLDLRYNSGGSSSVGLRLAAQIAGSIVDGKIQSRFEHNDKYTQFDYEDNFFAASPSLDLNRLIVLTTERTASASERLINSLRPYIEVVTIGSTTRGKPYRSNGRRYCGKILNAMQVQGVNSAGVSVIDGISADCYASDDISKEFGSNEGMFQSALDYLFEGSCLVQPHIAARSTVSPYPKSDEHVLYENMSE